MAGSGSTWPSRSRLSQVPLLVLVALVLLHSASSEPSRDFVPPGRQKREVPADFLSQMGRSVRGTLEAWIGPETMHVVSETTSQVLGAVSSCISVGFFALSGIAAQLLNALGLDGDHLTQVLQLSPGQVQTLLLWGVAALVVYWLLSLLLGLVLALLGRILWGLKLVLFLVGFVALSCRRLHLSTPAAEELLTRPLPWPGRVAEQTHRDGTPFPSHALRGAGGVCRPLSTGALLPWRLRWAGHPPLPAGHVTHVTWRVTTCPVLTVKVDAESQLA
ncbi:transmembrane protein 109 isoform X3 [Eptesicus fuscus]|nr:transmembrane protein 109 isoform X3 [Eptesicus fuscus]